MTAIRARSGELFSLCLAFLICKSAFVPIPTKPLVCNGMIAAQGFLNDAAPL
jgi:hypothetical protein